MGKFPITMDPLQYQGPVYNPDEDEFAVDLKDAVERWPDRRAFQGAEVEQVVQVTVEDVVRIVMNGAEEWFKRKDIKGLEALSKALDEFNDANWEHQVWYPDERVLVPAIKADLEAG